MSARRCTCRATAAKVIRIVAFYDFVWFHATPTVGFRFSFFFSVQFVYLPHFSRLSKQLNDVEIKFGFYWTRQGIVTAHHPTDWVDVNFSEVSEIEIVLMVEWDRILLFSCLASMACACTVSLTMSNRMINAVWVGGRRCRWPIATISIFDHFLSVAQNNYWMRTREISRECDSCRCISYSINPIWMERNSFHINFEVNHFAGVAPYHAMIHTSNVPFRFAR